jgi:hypothetical protein
MGKIGLRRQNQRSFWSLTPNTDETNFEFK